MRRRTYPVQGFEDLNYRLSHSTFVVLSLGNRKRVQRWNLGLYRFFAINVAVFKKERSSFEEMVYQRPLKRDLTKETWQYFLDAALA